MIEKEYKTRCGVIHYWTSDDLDNNKMSLILLPGLTADHRLFDKQIEVFEKDYNLFVWDAPAHKASWPFTFDFDLKDKATWLDEILNKEGFENRILVGQSMGGYVGQAYVQYFPGKLKGFVSIDSAPLQRSYYTGFELYLLKKMEPIYNWYPWKALLRDGSKGVATTQYGRDLMREMMMEYNSDKSRYAKIAGHGYIILAEAVELNLPYQIDCPAILICGEKDQAGSCKGYDRRWAKTTGLPIYWIKDAGHNSNTDKPEEINQIISDFVKGIA